MIEQTHEEIIEQIKQELLNRLQCQVDRIPYTKEGFEMITRAFKELYPVPPNYKITSTYDEGDHILTVHFTKEDSTW